MHVNRHTDILVTDLCGICHMTLLAAGSGRIHDIIDALVDFTEICHRADLSAVVCLTPDSLRNGLSQRNSVSSNREGRLSVLLGEPVRKFS